MSYSMLLCGKSLDENAVETSELHRWWSSLKGMLDCDDGDDRKRLTIRMKCMVLDLLELRESSWNPKRYSAWQRKKEMVAKSLKWHREAKMEAGNSNRSSRRGGRRKGKIVELSSLKK